MSIKNQSEFTNHLVEKLDAANKTNDTFAAHNIKDRLDRIGVIIKQDKKGTTWRMREGI